MKTKFLEPFSRIANRLFLYNSNKMHTVLITGPMGSGKSAIFNSVGGNSRSGISSSMGHGVSTSPTSITIRNGGTQYRIIDMPGFNEVDTNAAKSTFADTYYRLVKNGDPVTVILVVNESNSYREFDTYMKMGINFFTLLNISPRCFGLILNKVLIESVEEIPAQYLEGLSSLVPIEFNKTNVSIIESCLHRDLDFAEKLSRSANKAILNLINNLSSEVVTENFGVGAIDLVFQGDRASIFELIERSVLDKIQRCNDSMNRLQSELASKRAELAEKEAKLSEVKEELNGHTTSVRTATHEINRLDGLERYQSHEVTKAEDAIGRLRNDGAARLLRAIPFLNFFSESIHEGNLESADKKLRAARDNVDETRRMREAQRFELLMSQQEVNQTTLILTGQVATSNELRQRIAVLESAVAEQEIQLRINEERNSNIQASLES